MSKPTDAQTRVLRQLVRGFDSAAIANDDFRGPLYWQNAMRVLGALKRRGWIDDDNEITDAGRAALAKEAP